MAKIIQQKEYFYHQVKVYMNKGLSRQEAIEFAFFDLKNKFDSVDLTILDDKELINVFIGKGDIPNFYHDKNDKVFTMLSHLVSNKYI